MCSTNQMSIGACSVESYSACKAACTRSKNPEHQRKAANACTHRDRRHCGFAVNKVARTCGFCCCCCCCNPGDSPPKGCPATAANALDCGASKGDGARCCGWAAPGCGVSDRGPGAAEKLDPPPPAPPPPLPLPALDPNGVVGCIIAREAAYDGTAEV